MASRSRSRSTRGRLIASVVAVALVTTPAFLTAPSLFAATRATHVAPTVAGAQVWAKRYDGPSHFDDVAESLATSPDGTKVFVTGGSADLNGNPAFATVAYNASTGAVVWTKRYIGPSGIDDVSHAVAVSPDGSMVFVTGESLGTVAVDYATIAYDASTGAQLWAKRYVGPSAYNDKAFALVVSPNSTKVFVTGGSAATNAYDDYATIAYNATSGAQLWAKRYNGPGKTNDDADSIGISPDGSKVFVSGASDAASGAFGRVKDYATVAYDSTSGTQLWVKRYNGPANQDDSVYALDVAPDGSKVVVTGGGTGFNGVCQTTTIAYGAATGAQSWVKRYTGTNGGCYNQGNAVQVSPDSTTAFVGGVRTVFCWDFLTIAYDLSTGAQLWLKAYVGPTKSYCDIGRSLGVSPDGSEVYLTGESALSAGSDDDYATIAYDAGTGAQLWVKRYNFGTGNPQDDHPHSLGVSPDGTRVFVTGGSRGNHGHTDFATVAYNTG